ncbi:MAG: rod shape-determining protein MreD [Acetobacteraceae bacterium]|nr:rod shape-determining protein MreD [Acetobacteraceae bacterium]
MSDRLPGIRPRPSIGRKLDIAARRSFPTVVTGLLLVLAAAPLGIGGQPQTQLAIALASVFFWTLVRPASMPPLAVFLLGLLLDLLSYAPLGVGVVILLVLHGFTLAGRRVLGRAGFMLAWIAFALLALGAVALQWGLTALLTLRLLPVAPAILAAILAVGLYPLLAVPLARAHRTLAETDQA